MGRAGRGVAAGEGEQGSWRRRWGDDSDHQRSWGGVFLVGTAGNPKSQDVPSHAGAPDVDQKEQRRTASFGNSRRAGSRGTSSGQAGAGTDSRGKLPRLFLRI